MFLFEPQDRTWGVSNADQIQLAPGQTYAAALLHRPPNYWLNRLLRPISSTVSGALVVVLKQVCGLWVVPAGE